MNSKTFKYSFKHIRFNKHVRLKKDFWDIQKLNNAYNLFSDELNKCKISTFYLHGPPKYILDYKYLHRWLLYFQKFLRFPNIRKKFCLGHVAWILWKELHNVRTNQIVYLLTRSGHPTVYVLICWVRGQRWNAQNLLHLYY